MRKILSYPLSVLHYLSFAIMLFIFHPLQWLCLKLGGHKAHKVSVDWLNFFTNRCINLLFSWIHFHNSHKLPLGRPYIVVTNHQSMYDIPPIIWHLRKLHPKFISKKELGKGIPSVSFNLRHGGSVLIDRKDPEGALQAIRDFAHRIRDNLWAAVIFPEGTRSRNGHPKKFQVNGLLTLFDEMPEAIVLPITINNSWKLFRYGSFPLNIGVVLRFNVHAPIFLDDHKDKRALIAEIERIIKEDIDV